MREYGEQIDEFNKNKTGEFKKNARKKANKISRKFFLLNARNISKKWKKMEWIIQNKYLKKKNYGNLK